MNLSALEKQLGELKSDGYTRSAKIEQILIQTTKTNGRVTRLEKFEEDANNRLRSLECINYKMLGGVAVITFLTNFLVKIL